jgi:hypothetical protein
MKKLILPLLTPALICASMLLSGQAFALSSVKVFASAATTCSGGFSSSQCSVCSGIGQLGGGQDCKSGGSKVQGLIRTAINIVSYIIGIAAVIMIIISAIKFTTSGGDSNSVSSAKSTLIWAIVGLVVAVLAQVIVSLTFNTATNISAKSTQAPPPKQSAGKNVPTPATSTLTKHI